MDTENPKKSVSGKSADNKITKVSSRRKYTFDIGEYNFTSVDILTTDNELHHEKVRRKIEKTMKKVVRCGCPLQFYGSIRENERHATVYAYCASKIHGQWFLFHLVN